MVDRNLFIILIVTCSIVIIMIVGAESFKEGIRVGKQEKVIKHESEIYELEQLISKTMFELKHRRQLNETYYNLIIKLIQQDDNDIESDINLKPSDGPDKTSKVDDDIYLLAQIIHAEAKGEPYEGMVAVANVVLNRVKSEQFPDTIREVVYQPKQFQPVTNGAINNDPSDKAIRAAREAFENNIVTNALFFYNPEIATSEWIFTREVITTIGNHRFAM